MSSFLCFLCHSTVNADTNEDIREKYREVTGMHLCIDSHLCHICCHVLNRLWLFRAVCLKRSLEYPVLFSEKGTLNLQRNELEIHTICSEDICGQFHNRNLNSKSYNFSYDCADVTDSQDYVDNQYVELREDRNEEYFSKEKTFSAENNLVTDTENYNDFNHSPPQLEDQETNQISEDIFDQYESETAHSDTDIKSSNTEFVFDKLETDYKHGNPEFVLDKLETDLKHSNTEFENDKLKTDFKHGNPEIEHDKLLESEVKYGNPEFVHDKLETDFKHGNPEFELEKPLTPVDEEIIENATKVKVKKKKSKKGKKKPFEKIVLTLEEQKKELEKKRKEKKYLEAEFKCYNCALGFLFKDSYQTHMMRHEESNGEYRCSICKLRFASAAVLRAHARAHRVRYICGTCGSRVGGRARSTHARKCGGSGAESGAACHLCGRVFQDSAGLQQHLKRFHQLGGSKRNYVCSVCGNHYSNQAAWRTHIIKHVNRKFTCDQCGAEYSSPYTLNQHKKKKHADVCSRQHYCQSCGVGYSSRKELLAHTRNTLNHQHTLFECPICGRVSPNQRSLSLHIESVHSGTKHYECPHCPQRYSNRKSLVRHIGSHQGKGQVKEAVCHLCGATFKGNNKLNRHLREVCEKAKLEEEFADLYEEGCLNPG